MASASAPPPLERPSADTCVTTTAAPPRAIDTAIIGTGPAALLLSYLLSGHQPHLADHATHPDPQLQAKLAAVPSLLHADLQRLTAHFPASRFSYSTQALPVNTLLDTLLRPLGDTAPGLHPSCIQWRQTNRTVDHAVLGLNRKTGGQWQEDLVPSSTDISALSYADLLTLPGYTMAQYLHERGIHDDMGFLRPTRRDVADYLAVWPHKVGTESSLQLGRPAEGIERTDDNGFYITSHHLRCRRIVLATGTFSTLVPPPSTLQPLLSIDSASLAIEDHAPLLVVGSGFSAADIVLTALPQRRRVLHLFNWNPADVSSPLRACHASAYPEYAGVFRRMKRAASSYPTSQEALPSARPGSSKRRKSSRNALDRPEWDLLYEGIPNATIRTVQVDSDHTSATITLETANGVVLERQVGGFQYAVGRRGSLAYLSPEIRSELLGPLVAEDVIASGQPIRARMLRKQVEESSTFELAPNVYAIGSLLGDSLVRHAYGGCFVVAREILSTPPTNLPQVEHCSEEQLGSRPTANEEPIKAASLEVAEAVALALSNDTVSASRHGGSSTPRVTGPIINGSHDITFDSIPISLEFSEPPFPMWFNSSLVNSGTHNINDHEHLGDARSAVLGSHLTAWGERSPRDRGTIPERQRPSEELTAY